MKFDKLRLLGFKSFVEPTEFLIEDGLTGVVGPNGCGKSNLVEALRWVMGESSYKNMRASGMDDVIFSGSGNRPARNMAEVALFLDNADRTAPAAFNDDDQLQVSRRIEREAGSNYRINGKDARAKDVQLLFADASTGARSPSMVGQGRIGELISAKPTQRRALLEEAAGISGLHSRRHEAELRLRAAEANLERLEDVLAQLESQLESLKRQARQASRYSSISEELRAAQATVFYLRWQAATTAEGAAQSALAEATTLVAERAQAQTAAARDQAVVAAKLPELRDAEVKAAAIVQRITLSRDAIEQELARLANRKRELDARKAQLAADLEREAQLENDNREAVSRLDEEERGLNIRIAGSEEQARDLVAKFSEAEAKAQKSDAALQALTSETAEARAARSQAERQANEAGTRFSRLEADQRRTGELLAEIVAQMAGLPEPARHQAAAAGAEKAVKAAEVARADAEAALDQARQNEQTSRGPLAEAQAELREIETEARTLAKIVGADKGDLFPAIVDALSVEVGYERALGAALGEDLDAPANPGAKVYWAGAGEGHGDPALPGGIRSLAEVVHAPDALARRLAQVGIVDADQGASRQAELATGQRLVSREGDLWRWDGLRASADAPTAAAQKLAQKNRLVELDAAAQEARTVVAAVQAKTDDAKAHLQATANAERAARDVVRDCRAELTSAREAVLAAERAAGQFAQKRAALEATAERLDAELAEADELRAAAQKALADAPDIAALEAKIESARASMQADRGVLAEARANRDGLTREVEMWHRRVQEIHRERDNWNQRLANAAQQRDALSARMAETDTELASLDERPGEIEAERRRLNAQIEEAEVARKKAADLLAQAETGQRAADQLATAAITQLSEAKEGRARQEERLDAAVARRKDVEARIRDEVECPPGELFSRTGLEADAAMPEIESVERKLEKLRADRDRLGAVNLRAEAEQVEIAEKRDSLVSEQSELIEAIAKLRGGIGALNRQGRERLLAAFDEVNGQFTRLFTHLFGGGTAELQLVESDDPLEAGLEILARPPGKRPQTMTLLSGGEQALTAMALIFAVFLTNPAPICVLDEVDAPLDDHNVERFCNLLDEMVSSTDTRFVIITHNPITMARMDRLFGVTMAERGVSQIVSVDLQAAEQMVEAS
ncbi:MAG: chromosome segregation SMC family protein [Pseudomonadota bacterium]